MQRRVKKTFEGFGEFLRQGLANAKHCPQAYSVTRGVRRRPNAGDKGGKQRRHEIHRRDPIVADDLQQGFRIPVDFFRRHHEAGAAGQGPEELADRDIEAAGRLLQNNVIGGQRIFVLKPAQEIDDRAVRDNDALRLPGAA